MTGFSNGTKAKVDIMYERLEKLVDNFNDYKEKRAVREQIFAERIRAIEVRNVMYAGFVYGFIELVKHLL